MDNALYDEYLGTGDGMNQLDIVQNAQGETQDYELLPVVYDEGEQDNNLLLVNAQMGEDGQYKELNLTMSAMQLARLWQDKSLNQLELRSGDASATLRIDELLSGDVASFINEALSNPDTADPNDVQNLPEAGLTSDQLSRVKLEICIAPVDGADESQGYTLSAYAKYGGHSWTITSLVPSLNVCMNAGEFADEEERSRFAQSHALTATDAHGKTRFLDGWLVETPVRSTGSAEHFDIKYEDGQAKVQYDANAKIDPYCRYVLCAKWDGDAVYRMVQTD